LILELFQQNSHANQYSLREVKTMDITIDAALNSLNQNPVRNFTIAYLLKTATDVECFESNSSLLIRFSGDEYPFVCIKTTEEDTKSLDALLPLIRPTDETVFAQGNHAANYIHSHFSVSRDSHCIQFSFPVDIPVSADFSDIIDLKEEHASFIYENYSYKDHSSEAYIKSRIISGPALGILYRSKLAGWVMTHEEMAMGVMHILPEYRRLGLATRLNEAMITRMRLLGYPCIVEIIKDNAASLALARSAGFVPVQEVHWMHLKQ
jgi:ribosomal protein S18 acetylase RimI-like enzyme